MVVIATGILKILYRNDKRANLVCSPRNPELDLLRAVTKRREHILQQLQHKEPPSVVEELDRQQVVDDEDDPDHQRSHFHW